MKRSLDYAYKALSIYQKLHNGRSVCVIISNIGDTYEKLNQLDSA